MNKDMENSEIDLQQLTLSVCKVAREAGAYINKERANFSLDKVER